MTTSTVTIVGDVSDLIGNDYDPSRTKVWVQHNTDKVVTDSGPIRLGAATKAVASDGTFSFANVVASTSLVENLQTTLWVDWPNTAGPERTRRRMPFGPYDLTGLSGTVDIRTLEATQALDPVASSALLSEMQDLRDEQVAISGIDSTDTAVAYAVQHGATTPGVLSASYGRRNGTVVIAASDSPQKYAADVTCTGTNDQVAINAAIANSVPAALGGKIKLAPGTFNISASIYIGRCHIRLEGEGWGFWNSYVENPTNPNLGPASGTVGTGITKIVAQATGFDLIVLDNDGPGTNDEGRVNGITIEKLYLLGKDYSSYGIRSIGEGYGDQIIIEQVFIHKTAGGILLDADCPYISHCTVMDVSSHGIELGPVAGVAGQIHHNVIADIGGDGIRVGQGAQYVGIDSNIIVRCNAGIRGTGNLNAIVTANRVWGNRDDGITFDRAAQINGNNVRDGVGAPIKIHDTGASSHAQQGIITGNRTKSINANPCIDVENAPHTIVTNNACEVATGGNGIVVIGSPGTIVKANDVWSIATAIQSTGYGVYVDVPSAAMGIVADNIARGGFAERFGGGATNQLPAATPHFIVRDNVDYSGAIIDTFTRADSTSSLGVADSGHTWLATTGVWGIASNGAYCVSGSGHNLATVPAVSNVGTVSAKVTGSSPADQGLVVRLADGGNYMLLTFSEGGTVKLYKVVSNAFTVIGSAASAAPVTGDTMSVTMTSGNLFTVKKNGTTLFTATDVANAAATRHGFWSFGNATASVKKWDDFSFQPA